MIKKYFWEGISLPKLEDDEGVSRFFREIFREMEVGSKIGWYLSTFGIEYSNFEVERKSQDVFYVEYSVESEGFDNTEGSLEDAVQFAVENTFFWYLEQVVGEETDGKSQFTDGYSWIKKEEK